MTEITLTYFPLYGRAETTRQMLRSRGVDFTDHVVTFVHWPAEKVSGRFEFRQMPMLEIDGHRLVTSQAIERYVARKYNLYPTDPHQAYLVESIIDLKNDQVNKFHLFKFVLKDEEAMRQWVSIEFLENLKLIEARLVANGGGHGFFVGHSATWADFSIFQFLHDGFYLPSNVQCRPDFEAATPKLKAFVDRFLANDARLAGWVERRPAYEF
jgi:glutathione S-transferase